MSAVEPYDHTLDASASSAKEPDRTTHDPEDDRICRSASVRSGAVGEGNVEVAGEDDGSGEQ